MEVKDLYIQRLEHLIHWYLDHVGMCEGVDFLHIHGGKVIDAPEAQEILNIYQKVEKQNDNR